MKHKDTPKFAEGSTMSPLMLTQTFRMPKLIHLEETAMKHFEQTLTIIIVLFYIQ